MSKVSVIQKNTKQKRQFWVILTIVFLGFVGISIPYLVFPALFLNPKYAIVPASWSHSSRTILLGITLAAYPLGQFFGSPILGSLSDDYGRKRLLSWSLLIAAVCYLLSGLAIETHQLWLLILSRLMAGLMEGNIAIARAMAADITTISKQETFGKINAVASIAFLLGPLLGGLMADQRLFHELTTSIPFYFICLLFFALAGLSSWILEKNVLSPNATVKTLGQRLNLIRRLVALFHNKRLQFLMITSTLFTLAVDIFYEFGPVYLTIKWNLSSSQLIIYNGALCLALAIGNGWLPNLCSSFFSNRLVILSSICFFALCLGGIIWTDSTSVMLFLFTFSGLVIGLAVTLLTVKISDSAADSIQGEVLGVQISLRVLGDAAICFFGGLLLILSSKLILIFAAAIALGALFYYGFARKI